MANEIDYSTIERKLFRYSNGKLQPTIDALYGPWYSVNEFLTFLGDYFDSTPSENLIPNSTIIGVIQEDGTIKKLEWKKPTNDSGYWVQNGEVISVNNKKGNVNLVPSDIGLGNVENTTDANKNVNSAVKDGSGNNIASTYETKTDAQSKINALTKNSVGLGNVDNTADANKVVKGANEDGSGNIISTTYETKADATTKQTGLQTAIAAIQSVVENLVGLEGTNYAGFSVDTTEADALAAIPTKYTAAGYTDELVWYLVGDGIDNLKAYHYDGTNTPVLVSSKVYDFTDFSGIAADVSTLRQDLDALDPEIFKDTTAISLTDVHYRNIDVENNIIISSDNDNARIHYAAVQQGERIHITATHSEAKIIKYGFTSVIPDVDVAMTGATSLVTDAVDVVVVSPVNGYIVVYKYSTYFTDLALTKNVSRFKDVEVLNDAVVNIGKKLSNEIIDYTLLNYAILTSGKFGTGTTYKHTAIPVVEGDIFILIGASNSCRYAFATSDTASSGGDIPLVSGTLVVEMLNPNTYYNVIIPSGCSYLLTSGGGSYGMRIYKMSSINDVKTDIDNLAQKYEEEVGFKIAYAEQYTAFTLDSGQIINSSGNIGIGSSTNYRHTSAIGVTAGELVKVKANCSKNLTAGYFVWFANDSDLIIDKAMSNAGQVAEYEDKTVEVAVPVGATRMYVTTVYGTTPKIWLNGEKKSIQSQIDSLNQSLTIIPIDDCKIEERYISTSTGLWAKYAHYSRVLIPVLPGKKYEIGVIRSSPDATRSAKYAFLKSKDDIVGQAPDWAEGYSAVVDAPANSEVVITAPADAKYLYLYVGTPNSPVYRFAPTYVKVLNGVSESLYHLINGEDNDIVANNDPINTINLLQQCNRTYGYDTLPQVVFLHFSDIHGDVTALERIKRYHAEYSQYITDVLNTGDTCNADPSDIVMTNFYTGVATKYLTVIGNHDAAASGANPSTNPYPIANIYGDFLAPFIANWGVTQPSDAATAYKCYYYKDYAESKLRMIVVDEYHYDTTQDTWLATTLADAITNQYHVLMVKHSGNGSLENRCTNFTDFPNGSAGSLSNMVQRVQDFIDGGGNFVAWLYGHAHYDNVGFLPTGENKSQLSICVSCANPAKAGHYGVARVIGTKSQDCFNIVAIDTNRGYIRVFRVGADYDMLLKHRGGFCFDYINKELVANW